MSLSLSYSQVLHSLFHCINVPKPLYSQSSEKIKITAIFIFLNKIQETIKNADESEICDVTTSTF